MRTSFVFSEDLKLMLPNLKIITIITNVNKSNSNQLLIEEISKLSNNISSNCITSDIRKNKSIFCVREAMSKLGRNPNRYLNSVEALFKRICKKKSIYLVNNIIDFNNYLSLLYQVPVGSYDLDKINGNIILRQGYANEYYDSISKDHFKLENTIVLSDDQGAFGSIISDSKRTSITDKSSKILTVLFYFTSIGKDIDSLKEELNSLYVKFLKTETYNIEFYE